MKMLVIAPQPFFSPRGTPLSVYYRTLVSAELGAKIDLLTYGEGTDPVISGVRIVRIPRFSFLGPVAVGPSWKKLALDFFVVIWAFCLMFRRRYKIVHAHEESVFFCRFLKPLFGFKLIYDMHSSLPEQLLNYGFSKSRLLFRAFSLLEDTSVTAADAVITICPALAEYAIDKMKDTSRHFLIENSIFDEIRFGEGSREDSSTNVMKLPKPAVVYAGTFEAYQGIDLLVRAFSHVYEDRCDVKLILVGGTPAQIRTYRKMAGKLGIEQACLFFGQVERHVAKKLTAQADVLLSPRTVGTNTPLKIYEMLDSGIPVVATRVPSHTQVLSDEVCILTDVEPRSFARGILAALEDGDLTRHLVRNAAELYASRYSRKVYESKMQAVFRVVA